MIELVLPVASPSFNSLNGHHWSKKHAWRKKWGWLVKQERLRQKIYCPDLLPLAKPRRVTIDRYGPRQCDLENIIGGCKQLIDALVAEGFLVDDSPAHMVTTYRQHVGKPYRTEVRIE